MSVRDEHTPNRISTKNTDNLTTILMIASDGVGYATYALLIAAGKVPWPGLDAGSIMPKVIVENLTTAGNSFAVAWNTLTAPVVANMTQVLGNTVPFQINGDVKNIWIIKTIGTDTIGITGQF